MGLSQLATSFSTSRKWFGQLDSMIVLILSSTGSLSKNARPSANLPSRVRGIETVPLIQANDAVSAEVAVTFSRTSLENSLLHCLLLSLYCIATGFSLWISRIVLPRIVIRILFLPGSIASLCFAVCFPLASDLSVLVERRVKHFCKNQIVDLIHRFSTKYNEPLGLVSQPFRCQRS